MSSPVHNNWDIPRTARDAYALYMWRWYGLGDHPTNTLIECTARPLLDNPETFLEGAIIILGREIHAREGEITLLFFAGDTEEKINLLFRTYEVERAQWGEPEQLEVENHEIFVMKAVKKEPRKYFVYQLPRDNNPRRFYRIAQLKGDCSEHDFVSYVEHRQYNTNTSLTLSLCTTEDLVDLLTHWNSSIICLEDWLKEIQRRLHSDTCKKIQNVYHELTHHFPQ